MDTGDEDDMDDGAPGGQERGARKARRRGAALPGEDRFMRLGDMEAFLQDAERTTATADGDASPGAFHRSWFPDGLQQSGVCLPLVSDWSAAAWLAWKQARLMQVRCDSPSTAQMRTKLGAATAVKKAVKKLRRRRRWTRCSMMRRAWSAAAAVSACALRSPPLAASHMTRRATAGAPCTATSSAAAVRPRHWWRTPPSVLLITCRLGCVMTKKKEESVCLAAYDPVFVSCCRVSVWQGGSCSAFHAVPASKQLSSSHEGPMCGPGAGTKAGPRRKHGSTALNGVVDGATDDEADPDESGGEDSEEEQENKEGGSDEGASEEGTDEGGGEDAGAAAGLGGAARGGAARAALSTHERQLARMAARIARMEEANMGEREWFLRGEAGAGAPLCTVGADRAARSCLCEACSRRGPPCSPSAASC